MMFAILLLISLGIGASLAAGSIVRTWLQYGSEWDLLAREMRCNNRAHVGSVAVRTVAPATTGKLIQMDVRGKPPVGLPTYAWHAAA